MQGLPADGAVANEEKNLAGQFGDGEAAGTGHGGDGRGQGELERELAGLAAHEERASNVVERMQLDLPRALSLREKRTARHESARELGTTRTRMVDTEAAAANARQERDRRLGVVESLNHEIAALEYDG